MWRMADGVPRFDEAIAIVLTRKSVKNERLGIPLIYPTVTLFYYFLLFSECRTLPLGFGVAIKLAVVNSII